MYGDNLRGKLGLPIPDFPGEVEEFTMLKGIPPIEHMYFNSNTTLFVDKEWNIWGCGQHFQLFGSRSIYPPRQLNENISTHSHYSKSARK